MVTSMSFRPRPSIHSNKSKTCIVPLFLSTQAQRSVYSQHHSRSRSRVRKTARSYRAPSAARSDTSTRDVIDTDAPTLPRMAYMPQQTNPGSQSEIRNPSQPRNEDNVYEQYPPPARQDTSTVTLPTSSTLSSNSRSTTSRSISSSSGSRPSNHKAQRKGHLRTKRTTTRYARLGTQVASKKRLAICFTISIFVSGIIYLALFVSHAGKGVVFHALSILLLVSLGAVAVHSLIRWLMLRSEYAEMRERRQRKRKSPRERGWAISSPYEARVGGKPVGAVMADDEVPERAMPVYMVDGDDEDLEQGRLRHGGADVGDVTGRAPYETRLEGMAGNVRPVRQPPPVYGNFRNSIRLNPNFLQTTNNNEPSPHTPTYDQAINDSNPAPLFPGMPGYRPPSYGSEGGLTAVLETRRRDVEAAMGRIHPLERERERFLGVRR